MLLIIAMFNLFAILTIAEDKFVVDFTIEEFDMLCSVVEREARDASIEHKRLITFVIVNRVIDENFPNTIYDVLHEKNQFNTIKNYYKPKFLPTYDTILAVYEVLCGEVEDITQGATYFYAPLIASDKASEWFENTREFVLEYEFHRFFAKQ